MSEDLTYSMLHEMMMKKFNLEANSQINLSFKLSSFDYTVDITDDAEPDIPNTPVYKSKPMISKQYSQQSEVKKGQIFDNKEALVLAVRLKALNDEQKNEGTVTRIKTDEKGVFEMLFIAIGASIRTFLNLVYTLSYELMSAHIIKGQTRETNLVAVSHGMKQSDVPIAFCILQGEHRLHVESLRDSTSFTSLSGRSIEFTSPSGHSKLAERITGVGKLVREYRSLKLSAILMGYYGAISKTKETSQSKKNSQSSSTTFIYKILIIPSFLDSCFISSTVSEDKRVMLRLDFKICAKDKNFSSICTHPTMMLLRVRNHHRGKYVHPGLS
ncbi:hypothetical protein Tco_1121086 [Tanacetum coccineum]|uniref:Uncharacterized protein n=1 Tax=Tanacetum coccineum TaxID=301880 RepID=A0ABQ5IXQ0_9ASTR